MLKTEELLVYFRSGIAQLLKRGCFENGDVFRKTQREALEAYRDFLARADLNPNEKLKGFFEIPTGIGKTALFLGIIDEAEKLAKKNKHHLRIVITVPTITLLTQTGKSLQKYAPQLADKTGYYGDNLKQLDKQLTVMTYDAFTDLIEAGALSSKNVNVLISDEAHRGTSERRIENIFSAFTGSTLQLAFTATARFDQEKSVEQTHHNRIFTKTLSQAVQEGELAAYIHTQLYVVRMEPTPEQKKRLERATQGDQYRYELRKDAWNARVIHQFREGRDQQTGDLLSDNITAFFVADTRQADRIEKLLCADKTLKARARAGGFDGVAVSIHSRMPQREQKRRMNAFMAGHYMAVIGDSKFKEGFDYAPLKTVFDFPRSSLVDKAQIIGRGARQWHNEKKNRMEGLTFMDYVVYVGSDDAKEEALLLAQAKRDVVYAWDVIESTAVFAPGKKPQKKAEYEVGGVGSIGSQSVTAYETLEQVNTLRAEIGALRREDWIDITPEIVQNLAKEGERTGIGPYGLFNRMKNPPAGLDGVMVYALADGRRTSFPRPFYEAIIAAYIECPDKQHIDVEITPTILIELQAKRKRTGLAAISLYARANGKFHGLSVGMLGTVLHGTKKFIRQDQLEAVREAYAAAPDEFLITPKRHAKLRDEQKRTGLGAIAIFKEIKNPPPGLNDQKAFHIMSNPGTTSEQAYYDAIIAAYARQADAKKSRLSSEQVAWLAELYRRLLEP